MPVISCAPCINPEATSARSISAALAMPPLVRTEHPSAVGAARGVPPPQDADGARCRRIRRGDGRRDAGRYSSRKSSATSATKMRSNSPACGRSLMARSPSTASVPIRDLNRAMDWRSAGRRSDDHRRTGHSRSAVDPGSRAKLHVLRFPLQRDAQKPQPHHLAAHHPAGAWKSAGELTGDAFVDPILGSSRAAPTVT